MDQQTIERLAISKLDDFLLKHPSGRYSSEFTTNDKTPFVDGVIARYIGKKRVNKELNYTVPVQIKGTTKRLDKTIKTYSFSREWLEYYARDKGLVFFVVFIDADTMDGEIFYRNFSSAKAKLEIKKLPIAQQSVSFEVYPLKENNVDTVLESFHHNEPILSRELIVKGPESLENLENIRITSDSGVFDIFSTNHNDLILTGVIDGEKSIIDTSTVDLELSLQQAIDIKFPNGRKLKTFLKIIDKKTMQIPLGPNAGIIFSERDNKEQNVKLNYEFDETTEWKDIAIGENILSMLQNGYFDISYDENQFSKIPLPENMIDSESVSSLKENVNWYNRVDWLYHILGKNYSDIELSNDSKMVLTRLLQYYPEDNNEVYSINPLNGVWIGNDKYHLMNTAKGIESIFSKNSEYMTNDTIKLAVDKGTEMYPGNPFVFIQDKLANIPDYNIDFVLNRFHDSVEVPQWYAYNVNLLGLAYLTAFDESGDTKWLDGAEKIFAQDMHQKTFEYYANLIQIQLRRNGTSDPQLYFKLHELKNTDMGIRMELKTLVFYLISKQEKDFENIWLKLTNDEKESIKGFPIYRIATKNMKDIMDRK